MPSPDKAHVAETSMEIGSGSKLKHLGDREVYAIGENMV